MDNVVLNKSFEFALHVVQLRKYLIYDAPYKELDISKQLLRSGTSVGANIEEAQGAQSQQDFLSKISIAYKEARESRYWIRLLIGANYICKEKNENILVEIEELCKLLSCIIIKTKSNLGKISL